MGSSIKDVAKKAGVSISTVSYALNGGPKPVADSLKERIIRVAQELDYRPSRIAKTLATGKSGVVGVIHTRIDFDMLQSGFMQGVLNGIAPEAQDCEHDVLLYTHSRKLDGEEVLSLLLDRRADGLLFLAPENADEIIDLIDQRQFPYVVISGEPRAIGSHILADNYQGVRDAMQHLFDLGHRAIGHITGRQTMVDGVERRAAYLEFMEERGLSVRDEWVQSGEFYALGSYAAARRMLASHRRTTAIFAANDESAFAAVQCARDMGLRVPLDLSVVGFDDTVKALICEPRLTSVRQPLDQMGAVAMRTLARIIDVGQTPSVVRFPTRLVIRESTTRPTEDNNS